MLIPRRTCLGALAALAVTPARAEMRELESAPSPPLSQLIRHPLLERSLYRKPVGKDFRPDGAAGANLNGYRWIDEQRQGAEWIVRGLSQNQIDWTARGWVELDWGLQHQQKDGGFNSEDGFHSTALFVEALARACLLDPDSATETRRKNLRRAARWLCKPEIEAKGAADNAPYTHQRYILAAGLGQAGHVLKDEALKTRAKAWAREGLGLQRPNGVNPEKGGFDASYQMTGVLMALRYLPVCPQAELRGSLRRMIRQATAYELKRMRRDGAIDADGSTRIGHERGHSGKLTTLAYGDVLQALVYGAEAMPEPEWLTPAENVARFNKWLA